MRVLLLLMFLLVGCATNSVKNRDQTSTVKIKHPDATTQYERNSLHAQSMRAQNRSIRVLRNISNGLR